MKKKEHKSHEELVSIAYNHMRGAREEGARVTPDLMDHAYGQMGHYSNSFDEIDKALESAYNKHKGLKESIFGAAGDPSVDIENPEVKTQVNSLLGRALETSFITPYMGIERISNVLSRYHIPIPKSTFLEGDHGYKVFDIVQFGHKFGMNDQGETVQKDGCSCSLYFEYQLNAAGEFDIFAEIVTQEELDEILNDVEAEENEERLDEAASQKASKALARILRQEKIAKTVRILNRNLKKSRTKKAPVPVEEPKKIVTKKKLTSKTLPLPKKPKAKKEEPKKVEPKRVEPKKVEVAKKAVKRIKDMKKAPKKVEPSKKAEAPSAPAKPAKSILFKREQKAPPAEKPKIAQKIMAHHPVAPKVPERPRNAFEIAWDRSAAGPNHMHPHNMKALKDVAYAEQQKAVSKASSKEDYNNLNNDYAKRMNMIRSLGHSYSENAPFDHIKKHIEDGHLEPDHVILANMHASTKREYAVGKITKKVKDSRLRVINKLSEIVHGTTDKPAIPGINPESDSKHKSVRKFHQVLGKFTKTAPIKVFTEQTMEKALEIMNKKVI